MARIKAVDCKGIPNERTSEHILRVVAERDVDTSALLIGSEIYCSITYVAAWLPDILDESSTGTRPRECLVCVILLKLT